MDQWRATLPQTIERPKPGGGSDYINPDTGQIALSTDPSGGDFGGLSDVFSPVTRAGMAIGGGVSSVTSKYAAPLGMAALSLGAGAAAGGSSAAASDAGMLPEATSGAATTVDPVSGAIVRSAPQVAADAAVTGTAIDPISGALVGTAPGVVNPADLGETPLPAAGTAGAAGAAAAADALTPGLIAAIDNAGLGAAGVAGGGDAVANAAGLGVDVAGGGGFTAADIAEGSDAGMLGSSGGVYAPEGAGVSYGTSEAGPPLIPRNWGPPTVSSTLAKIAGSKMLVPAALLGTNLALGARARGKLPPGAENISNITNTAMPIAQRKLAQAQSGQVTPQQKAALDRWQAQNEARVRQFWGGQGVESSGEQSQLGDIGLQRLAAEQQYLDTAFSEGMQALGVASQAQMALAQMKMQQDQEFRQAVTGAIESIAMIAAFS